jgi:Fe-S-cluster containining protein
MWAVFHSVTQSVRTLDGVQNLSHPPLPPGDKALIQIVDAALADATRRSGSWLVCRPGCTQCCIGPFPISQLDAARLQAGLRELSRTDPDRATRVSTRAHEAVTRLTPTFPGDPITGILAEDDAAQLAFDDFANDEPCPALDPATGTCDLYAHRPMTCREFGPPVRVSEDEGTGFSICELCFQGATPEEIAACEMIFDPDCLESQLIEEVEASGFSGQTIVAFSLRS